MEAFGLDVLLNGSNAVRLLAGLGTSLSVAVASLVLSVPLGLLLGVVMTSRNPAVRAVCRLYLETVRIVPQLVLLFVAFFGSTRVLRLDVSAEAASVAVFTFWGTAELGDLVRGALVSVPAAQYDAARALGLRRGQVLRLVVVPQALRRLVPQAVNLATRMVKTTSLVMMIGVVEVMKVGQQIVEANRTASPNAVFGVYGAVLLLYFLACWPLSVLASRLEKRWDTR